MTPRRAFLAFGAAAAAASAQTPPVASGEPPAGNSPFSDPDFGFAAQVTLGSAYYRGADPGKLLSIASHIKPGDFESAYRAYSGAGEEARKLADASSAKHHRVSAREAYLWAAGYFAAAIRFLDATSDPQRMLPCWQDYNACWTSAAALFDPPVEKLEIPYEGASLTAWFLRVDSSRRRRPLVILNTGADGLEKSMYVLGGAGALARGYNALILNGPGQGDSLWVRKLYFRFDWEKVITPVVDAMIRHREVDAKRIALVGVSQGGYWVPRALAFEHRIAAGIADPGVFDVSEAWTRNLPPMVRTPLDAGKKEEFNRFIQMGTASNARVKGMLRFRMRPFGKESFYDAFHAVREYNLTDVVGRIQCPMLVTDPEGEQFFPGQAQKLYDSLRGSKHIVHFTHEQGAGEHCEAAAPGLRDHYIYDWLDETLG